MYLPMGFSPGQNRLAVAAFTITTPADFSPSASVNRLPASNGMRMIWKYSGVTAPAQSSVTGCPGMNGCPSISTGRSGRSLLKGAELVAATSATPFSLRARRSNSS
jgi:hypothetical protein